MLIMKKMKVFVLLLSSILFVTACISQSKKDVELYLRDNPLGSSQEDVIRNEEEKGYKDYEEANEDTQSSIQYAVKDDQDDIDIGEKVTHYSYIFDEIDNQKSSLIALIYYFKYGNDVVENMTKKLTENFGEEEEYSDDYFKVWYTHDAI